MSTRFGDAPEEGSTPPECDAVGGWLTRGEERRIISGTFASTESTGTKPLGNRKPHRATQVTVHVVPEGQVLTIHAAAIISDVDDNALKKSGEHVHDGCKARFARALTAIYFSYFSGGEKAQDLNVKERLERAINTGSIFEEGEWNREFRPHCGKAEEDVVELIARTASQRLQFNVDHNLYAQQLDMTIDICFNSLIEGVQADSGLLNFLGYAKSAGMDITFCSASGERFILRALESRGLLSYVSGDEPTIKRSLVVCGAHKKDKSGNLNSQGYTDAINRIGALASQCFAVGDTTSDLSALLAGIPLVCLVCRNRDGSETTNEQFQSWTEEIRNFIEVLQYAGNLSHFAEGPQVFLVKSLEQLRAAECRISGNTSAHGAIRERGKSRTS